MGFFFVNISVEGAKRLKTADTKTSGTTKPAVVSAKVANEKSVASAPPVKGPAGDNSGPVLTGKSVTLPMALKVF